jgi:hypothetical protein
MSAKCERIFTSAKKLITPEWNRMHEQIIEASERLKNWWGPWANCAVTVYPGGQRFRTIARWKIRVMTTYHVAYEVVEKKRRIFMFCVPILELSLP